jgi:sugar lactone lactonase YvrE
LWASETQFWQVGSFEEFLHGNLQGVSLGHEGALELAPSTEAFFDPEQTLALSLAADRAGNLYIGTGHEGKVFRVDSEGHGKLIFQAPQPEILAVAAAPGGDIYAASSPDGKIYRVTADGKSSVFFDPKAKYIWSLAFDSQGRLYAGTGDSGLIYQIDSDGKGRTFFESRQTHIICLAFDRDGNLLAGSDPDGLVFRITPQGTGFVLYKADFPEVHALVLDSEGRVYAAALGGSGAMPNAPFLAAPVAPAPQAAPITVTVTASGGELPAEGSDTGKGRGQQPTPQPAPPRQAPQRERSSPSFNRAGGAPIATPTSPLGRGALVRISPDNSVDTLWSSDKQSIFGLALEGKNVLFSTDGSGQIFRLSPSSDGPRLTLVTETREALATRLLVEGTSVYVTTSDVAKLFRVATGPAREGTYESPVKDTKFVSRWGNLTWRAQVPAGCSLEFYTRAGNSETPDRTWSEWNGPYTNPDNSRITSPAARYIQWKAAFKGPGGSSPVLDDVTLGYLNQNLPPAIRSLEVSTAGSRTGIGGGGAQSGSQPLNVEGSGAGFTGATATAGKKVPTTFNWQADDPNGDRLVYSLYLKAADERDWHLVKNRLHETSYTLDPNATPDGEYLARLVASDEESNPPSQARRSELVSAPFWIDNTPPRVEVTEQHLEGTSAEVRFRASSNLSPLRSAETSLDGGEWRPVGADDGIIDSRTESFTVRLSSLVAGEHQLLLRAYDIAGNTGIGKAVLRTGTESSTE